MKDKVEELLRGVEQILRNMELELEKLKIGVGYGIMEKQRLIGKLECVEEEVKEMLRGCVMDKAGSEVEGSVGVSRNKEMDNDSQLAWDLTGSVGEESIGLSIDGEFGKEGLMVDMRVMDGGGGVKGEILIGDSIVREVGDIWGEGDRGRRCRITLGGGGIKDIRGVIEREVKGEKIIVFVGANDLNKLEEEDMVKEMKELVKVGKKYASEMEIVGMIPRFDRWGKWKDKIEMVNKGVRAICKEAKVGYADFGCRLNDRYMYERDGVHLNCRGRKILGEGLKELSEDGNWGKGNGVKVKGKCGGKKVYKRRATGELILGFINMQGGRRVDKWEGLQRMCKEENMDVMGLVETHLRGEEVPHVEKAIWMGENRMDGEKKGGGVGVLDCKEGRGVERIERKCKEHIWVSLERGGQKWALGIVYMAVDGGKEEVEWNRGIYKCLEEDIGWLRKSKYKIILMGDFNGHIEELEGRENKNGKMMKEFCDKMELEVGNLMGCYKGGCTWSRGMQKSTIDYVLIEGEWKYMVRSIKVCDEEERGCESDHNMIMVKIKGWDREKVRVVKKREGGWDIGSEEKMMQYANGVERRLKDNDKKGYGDIMEVINEVADKELGKQKERVNRLRGWDKGIQDVVNERKRANREYKKALKEGDEIQKIEVKWKKYVECKKVAKMKIMEYKRGMDRKMVKSIRNCGKEGCRKFWKYVKRRKGEKGKEVIELESDGMVVVDKESLKKLLNSYANNMQGIMDVGNKRKVGERGEMNVEGMERERLEIGICTFERALRKLKEGKARGTDGVAAEMVKVLGVEGREVLRKTMEEIMNGGCVPEEWKETRVRLVFKGKGKDKKSLENYRPIAVTSVIYKIFMYIMKEWVMEWAEGEGVLGELQHGFRKGRDMGDCIFVISQLIERSIREDKRMVLAFLDVKKAYDMVNREKLWGILREMGMRVEWIEVLERMYEGNRYMYQWGEIESDMVGSEKGLRQGCPMSAVLFILYINKLDQRLIDVGKGISIRGGRGNGKKIIPGVMFADDVVLMAESREDMQCLLNECEKVGKELDLEFSVEKSKIMWVNKKEEGEWRMGDGSVEEVDQYDYLGITIKGGRDYLSGWEEKVINKARRNKGIIKRVACMSYSRYEVIRVLWKGVVVPGVMYGNDVLVMSSRVRRELENMQKEMGRYALGGRCKTAVEAIQGDMGWSMFEEREIKAKLKRYGRMQMMSENKVCKWVFRECMLSRKKSKWWGRVVKMAGKVDRERIGWYLTLWEGEMEGVVNGMEVDKWNKGIEKLVREDGEKRWRDGIGRKRTLVMYGNKEKIREEGNLYSNDRGSELLFQARAGDLRTKVRVSAYMGDGDKICDICGDGEENVEHVLMYCKGMEEERLKIIELGGKWEEGRNKNLRGWLGFEERGKWIEGVKRLLERWERLVRGIRKED